MKNNIFISYDLKAPNRDYTNVINTIKELGAWARIQQSLWFVSSDLSTEEITNKVWQQMDSNDNLIVINTNENAAYWNNLSDEVSNHIKENWTHQ